MAGISSLYRLGDPLNMRLSGVTINQPDLPHWATSVLNWLGMVHAMQQATGSVGKTYGEMLKMALDTGTPVSYVSPRTGKRSWMSGPASIYGLYQQFCAACELEANR